MIRYIQRTCFVHSRQVLIESAHKLRKFGIEAEWELNGNEPGAYGQP